MNFLLVVVLGYLCIMTKVNMICYQLKSKFDKDRIAGNVDGLFISFFDIVVHD